MHLDEEFLKRVVPEATVLKGGLPAEVAFSVDSRTAKDDELFVPLEGERTDGFNFLEEALQSARGALVAQDKQHTVQKISSSALDKKLIIVVRNPEEAFLNLAAAWRAKFSFPIVAITGSVGKTTTKGLVSNIMKRAGKNFFCSYGNQNTLVGVSLNMVRLSSEHEGAIFEVGINKQGEMKKIAQHLQPTTALITGVGHSHMEGLGPLASIAVEKRAIFSHFKEGNIGIINGDQDVLSGVGYPHPVVKFGAKTTNQIQARKVKVFDNKIEFILKLYGERFPISIEGNHEGYVNNVLAAAAAGCYLEVPYPLIAQAVQEPVESTRRFQTCPLPDNKGIIIDDAYNASPESMKAALLALQKLRARGKKIAILGDMLELGQTGPFWHRQLGRFLRKVPSLEHLILVGDQVQWIQKTAPVNIDVEVVPSWKEATERLREKLDEDSVVLVKGSNGMKLGNLVKEFTAGDETPAA